MRTKYKFIDKLSARIENIQKEDKSSYTEDYKQHLSVEEAVYRRVKSELEFQSLSPIDKQAKRIEYLASCRKSNGNCDEKLKTILIYDLILVSMPYLKVLNHLNKLSLIEELCIKELDIIDDNLFGDVKMHVTNVEIENAFRPYFDTVYPFKMNMLKECYEKIEALYKELIKLQEKA